MLLDSASGKKAGALALSLTTQTAAIAVLLLIPLIYTRTLQPGQSILPTFLPAPPHQPPPDQRKPVQNRERIIRRFTGLFIPKSIPQLNTQINDIDDPPGVVDYGLDGPPPTNLGPISRIAMDVPPPPAPDVKPPVETVPAKPVAVGGTVLAAKLIHKVVPVYPVTAKMARISGTVRLVGVVGKDGTIRNLQVVSGNPLLVQAALDAVRQWIYTPTILDGVPVEVTAPIDVVFSLMR